MKNKIGLHLRVHTSLQEAVQKAERMQLARFQLFFMNQEKQMLFLSEADKYAFKAATYKKFDQMIAHATYWTHIMHPDKLGFKRFVQETQLAQELGFTDMVIHPGAFRKETQSRSAHYADVVESVHQVLDQTENINIIFENVAHKGRAFSGDIVEYAKIFDKLRSLDRVKLCIDTAHLFVFGLDIKQAEVQEKFFQTLTKYFDTNAIALLHLNDAKHMCSSGVDQHVVPGHGKIGLDPLITFINHPAVVHAPIILEMPELDEAKELEIIASLQRKHS